MSPPSPDQHAVDSNNNDSKMKKDKKKKKKKKKKHKKKEKQQTDVKNDTNDNNHNIISVNVTKASSESTSVDSGVTNTDKDKSKLLSPEKKKKSFISNNSSDKSTTKMSKNEKKKRKKRKRQQQQNNDHQEEKQNEKPPKNNTIQKNQSEPAPIKPIPKAPPSSPAPAVIPQNPTRKIMQKPMHDFPTDQTDHCETPLQAYIDICPLLDYFASTFSKTRSSLVLYDPYYCNGGIVTKLNSLGFNNVINQNVDFYKSVENQKVPEYDVLVTNPPYSGVHVEKLLQFVTTGTCVSSDDEKEVKQKKKKRKIASTSKPTAATTTTTTKLKPYVLLLPHYVYTKPYYQNIYSPSTTIHTSLKPKPPLFLIPPHRYSYLPPSWVTSEGSTAIQKGKDKTAPFPSFWYCSSNHQNKDQEKLEKWLVQTYNPSGIFNTSPQKRKKKKKRVPIMQYANSTKHIPYEYQGELDVQKKKRPNPRTRKRMMAMRLKQRMNG